MTWAALALLALSVAGCGTATDIIAVKTWDHRGETVGEYVYVYCTRGTAREQLIFSWGVERTAGPHRILIICDPR